MRVRRGGRPRPRSGNRQAVPARRLADQGRYPPRHGDYAETLRTIAKEGPGVVYGGAIGRQIADHFARAGGLLSLADLANYATIERQPVRGTYRGFEVIGPPPPSSGGAHIVQMLNILEGFDIRALGFGTVETLHLLAEALKIAFADRKAATADPAFTPVPVARLTDKAYADERRALIDRARARTWTAGVQPTGESANTTHLTVADGDGNVVCSTQTINSLFGARFVVPGTGIIPNNYMYLFDPHPGFTQSIAPGKRVTSSMSPLIVLKDGKPAFALGLPGAAHLRLGHAGRGQPRRPRHEPAGGGRGAAPVDARRRRRGRGRGAGGGARGAGRPRPRGGGDAARRRRHECDRLRPRWRDDGAACWRADGTPVGVAGGLARANVRFWPDRPKI